MIPSSESGQNLSLAAYEPLAVGTGTIANLSNEITSYSHRIAALGGFDTASITLAATGPMIEEWAQHGLDRRIHIFGRTGLTIWEGFVNSIGVRIGRFSMTIGPVMSIANRVSVKYKQITNTALVPPVYDEPVETAVANDTDSQALYGILPKTLSGGDLTATDAEELRDSFIVEEAWPKIERSLGSAEDSVSLTLNLAGYYNRIKYPYTDTSSTGTTDASQKIKDVLDASPDGSTYINSNQASIIDNTLQVAKYEDNGSDGWSIIAGIAKLGDANDNRWDVGVYASRKVYYRQRPDMILYSVLVTDPPGNIRDAGGRIMVPEEILPGQWIRVDGISPTQIRTSQIKDLGTMYIEAVRYSMPNNLELEGSRATTLAQKIARLGLGGL